MEGEAELGEKREEAVVDVILTSLTGVFAETIGRLAAEVLLAAGVDGEEGEEALAGKNEAFLLVKLEGVEGAEEALSLGVDGKSELEAKDAAEGATMEGALKKIPSWLRICLEVSEMLGRIASTEQLAEKAASTEVASAENSKNSWLKEAA